MSSKSEQEQLQILYQGLRLLSNVEYLLTHNDYKVKLDKEEVAFLLSVRNGSSSVADLLKLIEEKKSKIENLKNSFKSHKADKNLLNKCLISIRKGE
jgi:hypothetical protein